MGTGVSHEALSRGALPHEEQALVFKRPPFGVRKVVLATNVAETSVTIDDVGFVIDTGRHKVWVLQQLQPGLKAS